MVGRAGCCAVDVPMQLSRPAPARRPARRGLALALVALAALAASGCVSTEFDVAPLEHAGEVAVVRGHRAADVAEVARLAAELDPLVRAIVRPRAPERPRIVVQVECRERCCDAATTTARAGFAGLRTSRYIVLRVRDPGARRFLLAHELVHWYADWAWDHLPIAVEEGLADLVASRLNPTFGAQRRAFLEGLGPLTATDTRALLQVERGAEHGLPDRARERLYLAGARVAERLGIERLREWCEAAEAGGPAPIPAARFLADPATAALGLAAGGP